MNSYVLIWLGRSILRLMVAGKEEYAQKAVTDAEKAADQAKNDEAQKEVDAFSLNIAYWPEATLPYKRSSSRSLWLP